MNLTMIDAILTLTPDDLPPGDLAPWTRSVSVAVAAARRKGEHPPLALASILSRISWTVQASSDSTVEVSGFRAAVATPDNPLLGSVLDVLAGEVPSDAATLLDEWWGNAQTPGGPIAGIAVLDDVRSVVDLRTVILPAPAWRWLGGGASLQAGIRRTQLVLNESVYGQAAQTLEQKSSGLVDRIRTARIKQGPGDAP